MADCRALANALHIPTPFDVTVFIEHLGRERGRPIHLMPTNFPSDASGFLISTRASDVIAYEQRTTLDHQLHIIAHEVGHILLGHAHETATPAALFPNLDPDVVQRILARAAYSQDEEHDAEWFASLLMARVQALTSRQTEASSGQLDPVIARVESSLGGRGVVRGGWNRRATDRPG